MAKVLVVDDEKLIVKGIRFSLEQDGFEVACAYDGEEALQMAKEMEYDMVLLDVMLPKLNGFEVCQAIREFSEMPIIMLTAKGDDRRASRRSCAATPRNRDRSRSRQRKSSRRAI